MKELMDTIVDVYSAPGSTASWDNAVESINYLCGGLSSGYFLISHETNVIQISAQYGIPEYISQAYESHGMSTDVRIKYANNFIPGEVHRELELVPSETEWRDSEWNQYVYKELGTYYWLGSNISTHGLWSDYIAVNRLKSRGQHTDEEKQNLQFLLPHLSKAGELHRLVNQLIEKYNAVLSVLDKFLVGLIILDSQERVVIANITAREISSISGAYHFTNNGHFKLYDSDDNLKLKSLLNNSNQTSEKGGHHDSSHLVIKNRSTQNDILLETMPIRDDGFPDSDNIQGTAIFVLDPERPQTFSADGLKSIFKLTQSESSVIDSMINGLSPNEIAEERNTSIETVRRQLKTAYSKTGTKGQLDLLSKAVKATPPIEKNNNDSTKTET